MPQIPTAIPEEFAEELLDKFLALRDVMQASDLIQELLDPLMTAEPPLVLPDVGRAGWPRCCASSIATLRPGSIDWKCWWRKQAGTRRRKTEVIG